MKKLLKFLFGEKPVEVSKEEILQILFHRGRMLLLDRVTFNVDGKVVAEFTAPAENCEGHEPIPGLRVVRGVDIVEMAFQLLGIIIAKTPEAADMLANKAVAAREIIGAKFSGFIRPGEKIVLETTTDVGIDDVAGTYIIESGRMVAKVEGKKRATITSVTLVAFFVDAEAKSLSVTG